MRQIILITLLLCLCLPFVYAEDSAESLEETLETANDNVDAVRETISDNRWLLGEEWRETLLNNKIIGAVDAFFHNVDIVFVVLFGRHYDFTLELFFSFLLWLFTIIWMIQAMGGFFDTTWMRIALGCGITVIIAQVQLFNRVSETAFRMLFVQTSALWSAVIFILILAFFVVYLYAGVALGRYLTALRVQREARLQKLQVSLLKKREQAKDKALTE